MNRTQTTWQRVSKRRPCLVCGKGNWCLYTGPAEAPIAAICARTESPKRCGEAGWLHILRDDGPVWPRWRRTIPRAVKMMTEMKSNGIDFDRLAADFRRAVRPQALDGLAGALGVSARSLARLGVGWSADRRAWCFPMRNPAGDVLGIRLRLENGTKLSVRGGKEGLFIPSGLWPGGQLLVAEGPTDCTALLDFGFEAVGRPNCTGGVRHVVELVKRLAPAESVVVSDNDGPGRRGAESLAAALLAYCPMVRVIAPPDGIKDVRAWRRAGATSADIRAAIGAAEPRRLTVSVMRKADKRCKKVTASSPRG